jgi:GNAT superfamily N-acetyltransferase
MIRDITPDDRQGFASLMVEFSNERLKDFGIIVDSETTLQHFDTYIKLPNIYGMVIDNDGSIDGVILVMSSAMMGSRQIIGQELVWYVRKDKRVQGVKLLRNMENKLRNMGCQYMMMIGLEGDHSCEFYGRFGYRPVQNIFQKRLV